MRLFTIIAVGALLATTSTAYAQTAPSCEQQLDAATSANLGLQKELLQSRYQTITLQEQIREQQKKHAEADPRGKAAEKK